MPAAGREVVVLQYQQVAPIPETSFDLTLPTPLKGAEPIYRGRVWLDAETAQIRRGVRDLTLRHPSLKEPLTLLKYEFDYEASRFGILTPRRIVVSAFTRGEAGADGEPRLPLGWRLTFAYSGSRRFDAGTPDASLDPPAKP